jgi:hypothetical protein
LKCARFLERNDHGLPGSAQLEQRLAARFQILPQQQQHALHVRRNILVATKKCAARAGRERMEIYRRMSSVIRRARTVGKLLIGIAALGLRTASFI